MQRWCAGWVKPSLFFAYLCLMKVESAGAKDARLLFYGFSAVVLTSLLAALLTEWYFLAAAPALLLLVYFTIVDFRQIFFILLACIPLSTEIYLPNGFGTDLPDEALMIGLAGVYLLYLFRHGQALDVRFFRHPITLLLLLHLGWLLVATILSAQFVVSFKFLLAKTWYVLTFFFLAGLLLQREEDMQRMCWYMLIPLVFTVVVVLARHSAYGFSFESVYRVLHPFYRNHVTYAAIMAVFVPFLWFVMLWYKPFSIKWLILLSGLLVLLVGIQLAYTRAAYAAIVVAAGAYFVIRWRLTRLAILASVLAVLSLVAFLAVDNRYLDFAPNYERTITHKDFGNLLEATLQMEDISTMERVYRWIAGAYMSKEKPLSGFGPGNFYSFYPGYTVTSFRTYVSHNPDQSGIHSYYLMILVEQGYIGLAIFLLLLFYAIIRSERIYHQSKQPRRGHMVMIAALLLVVISILQTINDLIETDKIGPFFFIALALLVNTDLQNQAEASNATHERAKH